MTVDEYAEEVLTRILSGNPEGIEVVKNSLPESVQLTQLLREGLLFAKSDHAYMQRLQERITTIEREAHGEWGERVVANSVCEAAKNVAEYVHNSGVPYEYDEYAHLHKVKVHRYCTSDIIFRYIEGETPAPGFSSENIIRCIDEKSTKIQELAVVANDPSLSEPEKLQAKLELLAVLHPPKTVIRNGVKGEGTGGMGLVIMYSCADFLGYSEDGRETYLAYVRPEEGEEDAAIARAIRMVSLE